METATETETVPAEAGRSLILTDRRQTVQAMRAARSLVRTTQRYGTNRICRLLSAKDSRTVTVLAYDGHRVAWIEASTTAGKPESELDIAVPPEAVKAIAGMRMKGRLHIVGRPGCVAIRCPDEADRWTQYEEAGTGVDQRKLENLRANGRQATVGRDIDRQRGLEALRAMPRNNGDICRMAVDGTGKIQVWATHASLVGPNYGADAVLDGNTSEETGESIVAGISREHLIDTLRDMRSRKVSIGMTAPNEPIRIGGEDRNEQFLISPKRMS